jgi:hypothetical protein
MMKFIQSLTPTPSGRLAQPVGLRLSLAGHPCTYLETGAKGLPFGAIHRAGVRVVFPVALCLAQSCKRAHRSSVIAASYALWITFTRLCAEKTRNRTLSGKCMISLIFP